MSLFCQCGHRIEIATDERERMAAVGGKFTCPNCGRTGKLAAKKPVPAKQQLPEPPPTETPEVSVAALFGLDSEQESQPIVEPCDETISSPRSRGRLPVFWESALRRRWTICGMVGVFVIGILIGRSSVNPSAIATQSEKAEVAVSPRYTIVDVSTKHAVDVEHRYVTVVVENPQNKEQVQAICRELYLAYKHDIEVSQPNASGKMVGISVYDSVEDARAKVDFPICNVISPVGVILPDWSQIKLDWHWRHPEFRPTDEQRNIYREYILGLRYADKVAHLPYTDRDGINRATLKDTPSINAQKKVEEKKLVSEMCLDYGVTREELARHIAYVASWNFGGKPTNESVDKSAQIELKRWTE